MVLSQSACVHLANSDNEAISNNDSEKIQNDMLGDNESEVMEKIIGKWVIIKFCGITRDSQGVPPEEVTKHEKQAQEESVLYIGKELDIVNDGKLEIYPAVEIGYYLEYNDLFYRLRAPQEVKLSEPVLYVTISDFEEFDNKISIIIGDDGLSYMEIEHSYYLIERK